MYQVIYAQENLKSHGVVRIVKFDIINPFTIDSFIIYSHKYAKIHII